MSGDCSDHGNGTSLFTATNGYACAGSSCSHDVLSIISRQSDNSLRAANRSRAVTYYLHYEVENRSAIDRPEM
jgi:hypothetical protein